MSIPEQTLTTLETEAPAELTEVLALASELKQKDRKLRKLRGRRFKKDFHSKANREKIELDYSYEQQFTAVSSRPGWRKCGGGYMRSSGVTKFEDSADFGE